ncbi:MAG: tRNA (adenosine(37)-N6)-threonylcarbamoyltransferase complex dimerization subunit type 1 TsaB [Oscillospiraceae bacterium]|nr:tRNA (adenosine(37)-N6)-threonylcarbamoyltransferase complex dimerization subunit type 1 TsaB [Oscillospiraceae bacterium]
MKIFAIDTTTKTVSVAAVKFDERDYTILAEYNMNAGAPHSRTLLPAIKNVLTSISLLPKDLDVVAVSNGPGSFTGLRIGIAAVKGISGAAEILCAGVSSLTALAYNISFAQGVICPVMDARRNQVYNALFTFEDTGNGIRKIKRHCADRAVSIAQLGKELEKFNGDVNLVGDGAELVLAELQDVLGDRLKLAPRSLLSARAVSVAQAAFIEKCFIAGNELIPNYLRQPQAVRELQESDSVRK